VEVNSKKLTMGGKNCSFDHLKYHHLNLLLNLFFSEFFYVLELTLRNVKNVISESENLLDWKEIIEKFFLEVSWQKNVERTK
jgi:hypothetical protein